MKWRAITGVLCIGSALLIGGCGFHPSTSPPAKPSANSSPDNSVKAGYISGFEFSYPANWSAPSPASQQMNQSDVTFRYYKFASANITEFPSFIGNTTASQTVSLAPYIGVLTLGASDSAVMIGMRVNGQYTPSTVDKDPALEYQLSGTGGSQGQIYLVFTPQSELIFTCTWQSGWNAVGQNGCNEIVSSLSTYSGAFGGL